MQTTTIYIGHVGSEAGLSSFNGSFKPVAEGVRPSYRISRSTTWPTNLLAR